MLHNEEFNNPDNRDPYGKHPSQLHLLISPRIKPAKDSTKIAGVRKTQRVFKIVAKFAKKSSKGFESNSENVFVVWKVFSAILPNRGEILRTLYMAKPSSRERMAPVTHRKTSPSRRASFSLIKNAEGITKASSCAVPLVRRAKPKEIPVSKK